MPLWSNVYSSTHPLHTSRHNSNPKPAGWCALKWWELTVVGPTGTSLLSVNQKNNKKTHHHCLHDYHHQIRYHPNLSFILCV